MNPNDLYVALTRVRNTGAKTNGVKNLCMISIEIPTAEGIDAFREVLARKNAETMIRNCARTDGGMTDLNVDQVTIAILGNDGSRCAMKYHGERCNQILWFNSNTNMSPDRYDNALPHTTANTRFNVCRRCNVRRGAHNLTPMSEKETLSTYSWSEIEAKQEMERALLYQERNCAMASIMALYRGALFAIPRGDLALEADLIVPE